MTFRNHCSETNVSIRIITRTTNRPYNAIIFFLPNKQTHARTMFVRFSLPCEGAHNRTRSSHVPLFEEKFVTAVTRAGSFRDVLNVLLNAAIVSAIVHRAHKFASAAPPFVPSVRVSLQPRKRERARATLIPTDKIHEVSPVPSSQVPVGHRVAFSNFHSREDGEKIVYLARQTWHSYAKTFGRNP